MDLRKHILAWCLVTCFLSITDPVPGTIDVQISSTFLLMVNLALAFYSISLMVAPLLYRRRLFPGLTLLILTYTLFIGIDFVNFNHLLPRFGLSAFTGSLPEIAQASFYPFTICGSIAVGYFLYFTSIERIKAQNQRENALLVKELNFLKNQFNSHITFNFLNYCYSKIHLLSHDTAEAIDIFSDMLRYSLRLTPGTEVPMEKEIEYIRNFIALQKLLSSAVYVNFDCHGDFREKRILPCVLITFVENAFTHGEYNNSAVPINISLAANDASVLLAVSNKKRVNKKPDGTKIGITNVKQLLQLHYENRYQLTIEDSPNNYNCTLALSLR
jgi:two-component system, LytTR family, sensor kinase